MKEYEGYIHIGEGLYYCEADGAPWSSKQFLGNAQWDNNGPLKKLTSKSNGYYNVRYQGKVCKWHRLVFQHFRGYLPEFIDHKNGPSDNRIESLRPATLSENNAYCTSAKGSSSKYLGVSWKKANNKWIAQIYKNGKKKHLGYYTDEKEAAIAYNKAALEIHKEFANLNIIED